MLHLCICSPESKAEFVRKVEDIEVTEREVAILEVEVSSDTAEVTWHKVMLHYLMFVLILLLFITKLHFIFFFFFSGWRTVERN